VITVNMRQRRTWWGRKRFELDDTVEKPKTFAEREEESIASFFKGWFLLSLIPAAVVGCLYMIPYESSAAPVPWPFIGPFMALAVGWILNLPNALIAGIRLLALAVFTYGRDAT